MMPSDRVNEEYWPVVSQTFDLSHWTETTSKFYICKEILLLIYQNLMIF